MEKYYKFCYYIANKDHAYNKNELNQIIDPNKKIIVEFNYPLTTSVCLSFSTTNSRGFTKAKFTECITEGYERIYREENETLTIPAGPHNVLLLNRNTTNGKYGIWGHDIKDLVLECAHLNEGVWRLGIGS